MSYAQQMEKYRQSLESQRSYMGDQSSGGAPLPADQSQNIYGDKIREYNWGLVQQAFGAPAGIGGVFLAKQAIQRLPSAKYIQGLYNQGKAFKGQMDDLFSEDGVKGLLNDPEAAVGKLSEGLKNAFFDKLSEATSALKQQAAEKLGTTDLGDVADAIQSFSSKIPSSQEISDGLYQAGKSLVSGAKDGVMDQVGSQVEDTFSQAKSIISQVGSHLKSALGYGDNPPAEGTPALEPAEEEDSFEDAIEPPEPSAPSLTTSIKPANYDELPDDLKEVYDIHDANAEAIGKLKATDWNDIGGKAPVNAGEDPVADAESANLGKLQGEQSEASTLTKNLAKEAEDLAPEADAGIAGADAGVDAGVEAGASVLDGVPVLGILGAVASIGTLIASSVEAQNAKAKLAKDTALEVQRQDAIQEDITAQQSEIVGEGRQEIAQQEQQSQMMSQQRQPQQIVPVSQVGTDRS